MVSTFHLAALAGITLQFVFAQNPQNTFRSTSTPSVTNPPAPNLVTPEMRGDIFMARKMYREAVETYKEGPQDPAVLLKKTGIPNHQMLELKTARKSNKRTISFNQPYAEPINNLGTLKYSRRTYCRVSANRK